MTLPQLEENKKLRNDRKNKNDSLSNQDENGLKYGLHKFGNDIVESKFYWGIRNGELKKIKIIQ